MNENKKAILKEIFEWGYCIVIAVVLALLVKYYVGTPTIVKHTSMYPTFEPNDRLILNRLYRTFKTTPQRGEVITFEAPTREGYAFVGWYTDANFGTKIEKIEKLTNIPNSNWKVTLVGRFNDLYKAAVYLGYDEDDIQDYWYDMDMYWYYTGNPMLIVKLKFEILENNTVPTKDLITIEEKWYTKIIHKLKGDV